MYMSTDKEPATAKFRTDAGVETAVRHGTARLNDEAMQAFSAACISLSEASAIRLRAEEAEQRAMIKALTIDPFLSDAKRCMLIRRAEQHAERAAAAANARVRSTDLLSQYFPP